MFHAAVAMHVAENGVYYFSEEEKLLQWITPNSNRMLGILVGISRRLCFEINPPSDGYIEWYQQADPCYIFGWPVGQAPVFGNAASYGWVRTLWFFEPMGRIFNEKLCTIGKLLAMQMACTGSIWRSVEKHGIVGFDGVGQIRRYSNIECKVLGIREVLEVYHGYIKSGEIPPNEVLSNPVFTDYGWLHGKLPRFSNEVDDETDLLKEIDAGNLTNQIAQSTTKASRKNKSGDTEEEALDVRVKRTYETIMCGLIAIIRGDITDSTGVLRDEEIGEMKQEKMIEVIQEKLSERHRISDSSLRKYLGWANNYRGYYNLPPVKNDRKK